jgi:hypothetical protein
VINGKRRLELGGRIVHTPSHSAPLKGFRPGSPDNPDAEKPDREKG